MMRALPLQPEEIQRCRMLGFAFQSAEPTVFSALKDKFSVPSTRSDSILSDLRIYCEVTASKLRGKGMAERLFWFFNNRSTPARCKTCGNVLTIGFTRRGFPTYCSASCRNRCPEFKSKAFDRFGGHPMKSAVVHAKAVRSSFLSKSARSLHGDVHICQGYEDSVIKSLICFDLTTDRDSIPTIDYVFNGGHHKYYPDLVAYMPLEDDEDCGGCFHGNAHERIVEVKSTWTLFSKFQVNLAKFAAATAFCELTPKYRSFWLALVHNKIVHWYRNPTESRLLELRDYYEYMRMQ